MEGRRPSCFESAGHCRDPSHNPGFQPAAVAEAYILEGFAPGQCGLGPPFRPVDATWIQLDVPVARFQSK